MPHLSNAARIAVSAGALALVASTAATALTARPVAPKPQSARPSPVNCSMFGRLDDVIMRGQPGTVTGSRTGPVPMPQSAPPPPPPPPPPAPSISAADQSNIVVTSQRTTPGYIAPQQQNRERYEGNEVASIQSVASQPVSTFSVDVDTGSYANVRRFLNKGQTPPEAAVRTEEMINYFRYDYPRPDDKSVPFSVTTNVATTPWNPDSRLMRIGLRGYDVSGDERPPANLVFLVDVSGSMNSPDKLPLVKSTLSMLADELRPQDRISIVVYSGAVGTLLSPTSNKAYVKEAIACMNSGGGTRGGEALDLAYKAARSNFIEGGVNRILLATDGDFNLGVTGTDEIVQMVEKNRDSGVTLTTLGYGTGNYREELMEQIADAGNGNYAYIDSAQEAQKVLSDELSATLFTIARDVKIQVEFNPAYVGEYRLIGYENRALAEEDFDNDKVDAGDIGAGHQVTAIYEIMPAGAKGWLPARRYEANRSNAAKGGKNGEMAFIKLRYKLPGQDSSRLIDRTVPAGELDNARAPTGDMAFATAVAAYGQKLRGDKYLGSYGFADARRLAGKQDVYWRQEFLRLTQIAESQAGS